MEPEKQVEWQDVCIGQADLLMRYKASCLRLTDRDYFCQQLMLAIDCEKAEWQLTRKEMVDGDAELDELADICIFCIEGIVSELPPVVAAERCIEAARLSSGPSERLSAQIKLAAYRSFNWKHWKKPCAVQKGDVRMLNYCVHELTSACARARLVSGIQPLLNAIKTKQNVCHQRIDGGY